ncbi:MAG: hypothetical protein GX811_05765, partial [Lentisphaerae bacterium]|nr:hypothetical protein [Lentisphaerota bacterium]
MQKFLWLSLFTLTCAITAFAIPNPAALYAERMGYVYKISQTEAGEKGL